VGSGAINRGRGTPTTPLPNSARPDGEEDYERLGIFAAMATWAERAMFVLKATAPQTISMIGARPLTFILKYMMLLLWHSLLVSCHARLTISW
jgi:hypothetical protein